MLTSLNASMSTSVAVLADTSVRSSQKLIVFIMVKVSQNYVINFVNKITDVDSSVCIPG